MIRRYNYWCMAVDSQQQEFTGLMERIDGGITIGMSQADVVAFVGQPLSWDSQGNQQFATYVFQAPGVRFDAITNGFTIVFSNGLVVGKSPIRSTRR